MEKFGAIFMHGNNLKTDRNKSYDWLPAVMIRLSPLNEKLMRKERGVDVHGRITAPTMSKDRNHQTVEIWCCVYA